MKKFYKYYSNFYWIALCCLLIWCIYNWIAYPQQMKLQLIENLHNPWSYVPLAIWIVFIIVVYCIIFYKEKNNKDDLKEIMDGMVNGLKKTVEENQKLKSGEIPSIEDINKYYKMYCKKFEIANRDQWTTSEPMTFDDWLQKVEKEGKLAWYFMISQTSDAFTFDPSTGQSSMYRFHDYESMIEEEK